MLAEIALKILGEEQEERGPYRPRPSSAGPERCIRSMVYHALGAPPAPFPGRTLAVFQDGQFHEELVKDLIRKSAYQLHSEQFGVECCELDIDPQPWWVCEVCGKLLPRNIVHGHIDGLLTDLHGVDRLLEVKSADHFSFLRFFDEPPRDYLTQSTLYLKGLQKYLPEIDEFILCVKNKNTAALADYVCSYEDETDTVEVKDIARSDGYRSPAGFSMKHVVQNAIYKFEAVEQFRIAKKLPPRPYEMDSWRCEYCSWFLTCYENYEKEFAALPTDPDLGYDFRSMALQEMALAVEEHTVTKKREETRATIKKWLHELGVKGCNAGPYTIKLSLSEKNTLDKDLLYAKIWDILGVRGRKKLAAVWKSAFKETMVESLKVREPKVKK